MAASDSALIEVFEQAVEGAVAQLVDAYESAAAALGPRPFGYERGDRLEQLAYYLSVRDDPAAWERWTAEQAQQGGRPWAEAQAWREATRLEGLLDRAGGVQAVAGALALRDLGNADTALRRLERIEELPKAEVRPPVGVFDPVAALLPVGAAANEGAAAGAGWEV